MDTVRESALEVDSGRKTHVTLGTQTQVSSAPGFSVGCSTNFRRGWGNDEAGVDTD